MRGVTKRPRRQNALSNNPATDALLYNGTLRMAQEQLAVIDLCYDFAATSSAGGTIADVLGDYPVLSPDWTSVAAVFGEYRVLDMEVIYVPNVQGSTYSTLVYAPIYVILDLTSTSTALTSYASASNYAILQLNALNQRWRMYHRMNGVEEATFVPTASATIDYYFKTFATGLTASTTYGRYLIRWKCQFRGRL